MATQDKPQENTPGVIILEWLSYAFWGWLIVALIWLLSVILVNAIIGTSVSSIIPYAIAAGVVLLPIAFFTDFFYRKHEPIKKTGAAMIIMVIHAVLFALLAIVALIVAVFNGLNAVIETSNIDGQLVILFTSIGATLLYAAAFIRVLNPFKSRKPLLAFSISMISVTVLLLVLAIVGPLVQTIATRDDRRIEQNIGNVSRNVQDYVETNGKVPTSLSQVKFEDEDAEALVEDGLVTYKAEASAPYAVNTDRTEHRFQLCVTYKEKDITNNRGYNSSYSEDDEEYSIGYLTVYGHPKGEVCYKMASVTDTDVTQIQIITPDLEPVKIN